MGFFVSVWASISDPGAYPELIRKTTGKCMLYLILLVLLFGTPVLLKMSYSYNQGIDSLIVAAEKEVPDFQFANGELEVFADMPIIIDGGAEQVIIIDTTGNTAATILQEYESGFFVGRHEVVSKENAYKTETLNYDQLKEFSFDKEEVMQWIPWLKGFWIVLLFGGLITMILSKLLATVILGLLGLLLGSMQRYNLTYEQALRLSAHALTTPIIFQACKSLVYPGMPFSGLIYYGTFIIYMWLAIKALKIEEPIE
ncbi:MAG: DUF1189 domain-containing protein [Syntrophomonadaceae bacterium]|jgi:hypothetical protein